MTEAAFWSNLRGHLSPFGVIKRLENRLDLGTPDTAYCLHVRRSAPASGFMELKYLDQWPVGLTTPVVIDHLTLEQIMWVEEWSRAGGRVWLVAQIGSDIVICNPAVARLLHERKLTTALLRAGATLCMPLRVFPRRQVLELLTV